MDNIKKIAPFVIGALIIGAGAYYLNAQSERQAPGNTGNRTVQGVGYTERPVQQTGASMQFGAADGPRPDWVSAVHSQPSQMASIGTGIV